ncbi:MAG: SGNH/GDSL hydrolase family protein [Draconibacterium sp.]|nr:SGNH/GDSL hydrolase family protein [Draconibacterium sp.]
MKFPKILLSKPIQNLPNVLILGDSISIGYTPFVKEMLAGKANVYRPTLENGEPENCEGTTKGIQNIERWLTNSGAGSQWDIIHFNFGLHDIKHVDPVTGENSNNPKDPLQADLKQYKKNMEIIVEKLKYSGARLIYGTTTPYPDDVEGVLRDPGMPLKYNRAAIKIMNRQSIAINDLYNFMLPRMNELQLPKNVHFKPEGYKELAGKVVARINEVIRDLNSK